MNFATFLTLYCISVPIFFLIDMLWVTVFGALVAGLTVYIYTLVA